MRSGSLLFALLLAVASLRGSHTALVPVSAAQCGKTKTCMRSPTSCTGAADCDHFLSWAPVNTSAGQQYLEVELAGKVTSSTGYIAIGFSADNRMGDDAVVGCLGQSGGVVSFRAAYNRGFSNEWPSSVPADFLSTEVIRRGADLLLGGSLSGSVIACRFRRALRPSANSAQLRDLRPPSRHFVMVSRGPAHSARGLGKHSAGTNVVSATALQLGAALPGSVGAGAPRHALVKAHGALMMAAWLLCAGAGVVLARHFKDAWPARRLVGEKVWFQVHRGLMTACVLLTAAGVVLVFVHARGYSTGLRGLPAAAHPVLGLLVTALAICNPIMALFRPKPDAPRRPIFNWMHFLVGSLGQIFAVATIFIGLSLEQAGQAFARHPAPFWILFAYVMFLVLIEALFALEAFMGRSRTRAVDMQMSNQGGSKDEAPDMSFNNRAAKPQPEPKAAPSTARSFILLLHVVGVGAFTTALVVLLLIH